MPHHYAHGATDTLEVDVDYFAALYAMALNGSLAPEEEDEVLDVAAACMSAEDLDADIRDFFQSAFLVLNKKNKRFIDLRKMNRMVRSGELGAGQQ
ncbi:MAG: hypothetical protein VXV96_05535 [Bdellovibrionota bacterium]|nr:hypothetical protein [Bdellovibrionota bacterium]